MVLEAILEPSSVGISLCLQLDSVLVVYECTVSLVSCGNYTFGSALCLKLLYTLYTLFLVTRVNESFYIVLVDVAELTVLSLKNRFYVIRKM